MKIGIIKKISKDDFPDRSNLPAWIDPFLGTINDFIQTVATALEGRLSIEDNFAMRKVALTLTSGQKQKINIQVGSKSPGKVVGMLPVYAGGKTIAGTKMTHETDGSIGVTLTFSEGGTSACLVYLLYQG